mgnify:CR=1 FL=1
MVNNNSSKLLLSLKEPIRSFSLNNNILALSQEETLLIYTYPKLELIGSFKEHDKRITSIDICQADGKILTTSEDRTCVVYAPGRSGYTTSLVVTRFLKSINFGKWNQSGNKFFICSADMGQLGVCYFDHETNWWISKHISPSPTHLSGGSLTQGASWDPENDVLVTFGDNFGNLTTVSTFLKKLDDKERLKGSPYGEKFPFGKILKESMPNTNGAAINDVAYLPKDSSKVVILQNDGSITLFDNVNGTTISRVFDSASGKPFNKIEFINATEFIVAGFNDAPLLYTIENGSSIKFLKNLSGASKSSQSAKIGGQQAGAGGEEEEQQFASGIQALKMFKDMDTRGKQQAYSPSSFSNDETNVHVMPITDISFDTDTLISSGLDGKLIEYSI